MNVTQIVSDILPLLQKLPSTQSVSVKGLVDMAYGDPVHFGLEYFYDNGYELSDADYAAIGRQLLLRALTFGLVIDANEYYEKTVGLPADATFYVRHLGV